MNVGESILAEIVKQGMVKVAHPDPWADHIFVWAPNCADQLAATVRKSLATCTHGDVVSCGDTYQWCEKCGAIRRVVEGVPVMPWHLPSG